MKIHVTNTPQGLVPSYPSDMDTKSKLKIGKNYEVEIIEVRNLKLHKKFFALIKMAFDSQSWYWNIEHFRMDMLFFAGFYDVSHREKGITIANCKPINFSDMDDLEFRDVYDKVLKVILEGYDIEAEGIKENIEQYM